MCRHRVPRVNSRGPTLQRVLGAGWRIAVCSAVDSACIHGRRRLPCHGGAVLWVAGVLDERWGATSVVGQRARCKCRSSRVSWVSCSSSAGLWRQEPGARGDSEGLPKVWLESLYAATRSSDSQRSRVHLSKPTSPSILASMSRRTYLGTLVLAAVCLDRSSASNSTVRQRNFPRRSLHHL